RAGRHVAPVLGPRRERVRRVIERIAGLGEDLTGAHVEHDRRPVHRPYLGHPSAQDPLDLELQVAVDGEPQRTARLGRRLLVIAARDLLIKVDVAVRLADLEDPAAVDAAQHIIEAGLEPGAAPEIPTRDTDELRGELVPRHDPALVTPHADAVQIELAHPLPGVYRDTARQVLEPDGPAVGVAVPDELRDEFGTRQA